MWKRPNEVVLRALELELKALRQCIEKVDGRCRWELSDDQVDQITAANRHLRKQWMKRADDISAVLE